MTPVQYGALAFLALLLTAVLTFFASGFVQAWVFVNRSAYDGGHECGDARVRSALLQSQHAGGADIPTMMVRVATVRSDSGDEWLSSRALSRRIWFWILQSDEDYAGAYCHLGSPDNFPALAKATTGREILTLSDAELAALAHTYNRSWLAKSHEDLIRVYDKQVQSMQENP